jgi:hypothetical protein
MHRKISKYFHTFFKGVVYQKMGFEEIFLKLKQGSLLPEHDTRMTPTVFSKKNPHPVMYQDTNIELENLLPKMRTQKFCFASRGMFYVVLTSYCVFFL